MKFHHFCPPLEKSFCLPLEKSFRRPRSWYWSIESYLFTCFSFDMDWNKSRFLQFRCKRNRYEQTWLEELLHSDIVSTNWILFTSVSKEVCKSTGVGSGGATALPKVLIWWKSHKFRAKFSKIREKSPRTF